MEKCSGKKKENNGNKLKFVDQEVFGLTKEEIEENKNRDKIIEKEIDGKVLSIEVKSIHPVGCGRSLDWTKLQDFTDQIEINLKEFENTEKYVGTEEALKESESLITVISSSSNTSNTTTNNFTDSLKELGCDQNTLDIFEREKILSWTDVECLEEKDFINLNIPLIQRRKIFKYLKFKKD